MNPLSSNSARQTPASKQAGSSVGEAEEDQVYERLPDWLSIEGIKTENGKVVIKVSSDHSSDHRLTEFGSDLTAVFQFPIELRIMPVREKKGPLPEAPALDASGPVSPPAAADITPSEPAKELHEYLPQRPHPIARELDGPRRFYAAPVRTGSPRRTTFGERKVPASEAGRLTPKEMVSMVLARNLKGSRDVEPNVNYQDRKITLTTAKPEGEVAELMRAIRKETGYEVVYKRKNPYPVIVREFEVLQDRLGSPIAWGAGGQESLRIFLFGESAETAAAVRSFCEAKIPGAVEAIVELNEAQVIRDHIALAEENPRASGLQGRVLRVLPSAGLRRLKGAFMLTHDADSSRRDIGAAVAILEKEVCLPIVILKRSMARNHGLLKVRKE
ncbi:MAG: hypothetical protein DCC75_09710 [Proteobacteria bacterium]|nr:MAG: hypothetical protein DCC75_09710 [Pseudomonadota bacterium]